MSSAATKDLQLKEHLEGNDEQKGALGNGPLSSRKGLRKKRRKRKYGATEVAYGTPEALAAYERGKRTHRIVPAVRPEEGRIRARCLAYVTPLTAPRLTGKGDQVKLWAYGYEDLAELCGCTLRQIHRAVDKGELDPFDLESVALFFLSRARSKSFNRKFETRSRAIALDLSFDPDAEK